MRRRTADKGRMTPTTPSNAQGNIARPAVRHAAHLREPFCRAFAFVAGSALLLNALRSITAPRWDASGWLLDLRPLPTSVTGPALLAAGIILITHALIRLGAIGRLTRHVAAIVAALLAFACACNACQYLWLLFNGRVAGAWVPISLVLCVGFVLVARSARTAPIAMAPRSRLSSLALIPAMVVAFLLSQILIFGVTDYRRPADAIVVLGARAYVDGTPSLALPDRVATGVALYQQGLAPRLIMSGGPGDGSITEAQAMAKYAVQLGVPREAILLDEHGTNTGATARNIAHALPPGQRVLAVSHAYHLARVKLAFQQRGVIAYTVPAKETRTLLTWPLFVAREVAALGVYFADPERA